MDVYAVEHPTANKLATHWMLVFADAGSNYTTNKQIKDKDFVVRCRCVVVVVGGVVLVVVGGSMAWRECACACAFVVMVVMAMLAGDQHQQWHGHPAEGRCVAAGVELFELQPRGPGRGRSALHGVRQTHVGRTQEAEAQ